MPAPQTADEFVELLQQSRLLAPNLLDKLRVQLDERKYTSSREVAKSLRRSKILTNYQASRLLNGEPDGFYLAKFKILDVLGRGGMGTVYLAEQITMHRLVAIKVMKNVGTGQRRRDYLTRFTREARAVAALNHPNIIRAFDFDEINGQPYIVMEYVEGLNAEQQVLSLGKLGWAQAADYLKQAALGLEHASQAKLVHRDIKPGNLLIGHDGCLKILDLGLVSNLHAVKNTDSLTTDAEHLGTVDYIAPEQALDSHSVDIRADIYSLGASFYFLVTGKPMFPAMSTSQKLMAQQMKHPQPIKELVEGIPDGLSDLVQKMIAKSPDDRPQTPQEVADALDKYAEAKSPPYDVQAVEHSHAMMSVFLRKSPHPSTISTIGASAANVGTDIAPTSPAPSQAQSKPGVQKSRAGLPAKRKEEVAVEVHSGDDWWEKEVVVEKPKRIAATPEQTEPGTRRRRNKKKSKKQPGVPLWMSITGGGIAIAALIIAVVALNRGGGDPTDSPASPSTDPSVTSSDDQKTEAQKQNAAAAQKRNAYRKALREDPTAALYVYFDRKPDNNKIRSKSNPEVGKRPHLNIVGDPTFVTARHWGHYAVFFEGRDRKQRLEMSPKNSEDFRFDSSFTVAVWFRTEGFQKPFETLISKGDQSWRLHRNAKERVLEFATNPINREKESPSDRQPHVTGKTIVDDDIWHCAVGVAEVNGGKLTLSLYLDGDLENRKTLNTKLGNSDAPVMIGGNSEYLGWGKDGEILGSQPGNRHYRGMIDEVLILRRALNDVEVLEMYDTCKPRHNK